MKNTAFISKMESNGAFARLILIAVDVGLFKDLRKSGKSTLQNGEIGQIFYDFNKKNKIWSEFAAELALTLFLDTKKNKGMVLNDKRVKVVEKIFNNFQKKLDTKVKQQCNRFLSNVKTLVADKKNSFFLKKEFKEDLVNSISFVINDLRALILLISVDSQPDITTWVWLGRSKSGEKVGVSLMKKVLSSRKKHFLHLFDEEEIVKRTNIITFGLDITNTECLRICCYSRNVDELTQKIIIFVSLLLQKSTAGSELEDNIMFLSEEVAKVTDFASFSDKVIKFFFDNKKIFYIDSLKERLIDFCTSEFPEDKDLIEKFCESLIDLIDFASKTDQAVSIYWIGAVLIKKINKKLPLKLKIQENKEEISKSENLAQEEPELIDENLIEGNEEDMALNNSFDNQENIAGVENKSPISMNQKINNILKKYRSMFLEMLVSFIKQVVVTLLHKVTGTKNRSKEKNSKKGKVEESKKGNK